MRLLTLDECIESLKERQETLLTIKKKYPNVKCSTGSNFVANMRDGKRGLNKAYNDFTIGFYAGKYGWHYYIQPRLFEEINSDHIVINCKTKIPVFYMRKQFSWPLPKVAPINSIEDIRKKLKDNNFNDAVINDIIMFVCKFITEKTFLIDSKTTLPDYYKKYMLLI